MCSSGADVCSSGADVCSSGVADADVYSDGSSDSTFSESERGAENVVGSPPLSTDDGLISAAAAAVWWDGGKCECGGSSAVRIHIDVFVFVVVVVCCGACADLSATVCCFC